MDHKAVGTRLSIMMFLQFFIWGAWYVPTASYMTTIGLDSSIGWIYTVGPLAALISPFFLGMIADRYFSTERVLGTLQIIGGLALLFAPSMGEWAQQLWEEASRSMTEAGEDPAEYAKAAFVIPQHLPFIGMILLHMLCYMPTLGLTNSLAFHNIQSQEKQFPVIRVFGTIGWIAAGWAVSLSGADLTATPLLLAGGCSVLMGLYSFTLPHTPPPAAGKEATVRQVLGLEALSLLKQPAFVVFLVSSMLICIPLAGYYSFAQLFVNHSGFKMPTLIMSFGQMSEIIFMLLMPLFFVRLGVKWMLLVGMLAWVVRYGLFSASGGDAVTWMILFGVILHGICYDFFFVTGFIYTDKKCRPEIRGQAQGLLVLVTQGIGLGIGAQVMQRVIVNRNKAADYDEFMAQGNGLREQHAAILEQMKDASGPALGQLEEQAASVWQQASDVFLQAHDWGGIWLIPCIMAGTVMALFFLLFWEKSPASETEGAATHGR